MSNFTFEYRIELRIAKANSKIDKKSRRTEKKFINILLRPVTAENPIIESNATAAPPANAAIAICFIPNPSASVCEIDKKIPKPK
jgi:hypothetical protein